MSFNALKQYTNLIVSKKFVAGEFAAWSVRQSPYPVPENLAVAVQAFQEKWPYDDYQEFETMSALEAVIDGLFLKMPEVLSWNERKNGRQGMGFSSRYDQPHRDDDFIDLGALSRNIAMSVWKDCVEFKKFNDDFDARWKAERPDSEE